MLLSVLAAAGLLAANPVFDDAAVAAPADAAQATGNRVDVLLRLARGRPGLQALAHSVSDPTSRHYGGYVNPRRAARRFGASRAARVHVRAFLNRHGIRSRVDVTRSFAEALVPARKARRLFGPISGRGRGRIPPQLRGDVRAVLQQSADPGQFLPRPDRRGDAGVSQGSEGELEPPYSRTGTPAGCEQGRNATFQPDGGPLAGPAFTPNQIQTAYGASRLHARGITGKGVHAAVLIDGFAKPELRGFTECFGIEMPPTRLAKIGRRLPGPPSDEATLDLQMLTLMAPGLESLAVYSVGSNYFPVDLSAVLERDNAPDGHRPEVISVSEGECESDLGRAHVRLTERVLAYAAVAGVTVAAGSGDGGSFCTSGRVGFYPGSSRWVSSVGGTSLELEDSNEIADEIVWNDTSLGVAGGGGGGLSRYLRTPFYQRGMEGLGGRRGYPDVALAADGYPSIAIYCGVDAQGNCEPAEAENPFDALGNGTSAATPLFAGTVALANQRRLAEKRPALGFVNPLLYRLGRQGGSGALRDVVEGSNRVFPYGCCDARPGYDLASGWGSVDAEGLAAAAALRSRAHSRQGQD